MRRERRTGLIATAALLGTTACWGSTFFLIHDLSSRVSAIDFLAIRFPIATVGLFLIFPKAVGRLGAQARQRAVVLGSLYAGAQILQTIGLAHTAASVSGFITGMYVVFTPLLAAVILRTRIGPMTWVAVMLAIAGIGVLTLAARRPRVRVRRDPDADRRRRLCAAHRRARAWSKPGEAMGMSIVQLAAISVVCLTGAAPGGIELPDRPVDWLSIAYMALIAGAFAMAAQTWAQAHISPTRCAIIMSMEPVFAALFAVLFGGESATVRLLGGGAFVLGAMLIVE